MFQHVILTRFNLQTEVWGRDKNDNDILSKDWLDQRIELFLKFCLPSVVGQTNKNFQWLIFFQEGTQVELKKVLQAIQPYTFIRPIFRSGYGHFISSLTDVIQDIVPEGSKFIISTRLDNDDAITKSFVEEVQSTVHKSNWEEIVIDFPKGLCLDLSSTPRLAAFSYISNQFISYLEKNDKTKLVTVFNQEHDKWKEHAEFVSVNKKNMWLQISHSRNLANRFKGEMIWKKALQDFNIAPPVFAIFYDFSVLLTKARKVLSKAPGWYFLKKVILK